MSAAGNQIVSAVDSAWEPHNDSATVPSRESLVVVMTRLDAEKSVLLRLQQELHDQISCLQAEEQYLRGHAIDSEPSHWTDREDSSHDIFEFSTHSPSMQQTWNDDAGDQRSEAPYDDGMVDDTVGAALFSAHSSDQNHVSDRGDVDSHNRVHSPRSDTSDAIIANLTDVAEVRVDRDDDDDEDEDDDDDDMADDGLPSDDSDEGGAVRQKLLQELGPNYRDAAMNPGRT